jgi:murein DD-endopeptidase MepM/ murein hydrolase activator NlpD
VGRLAASARLLAGIAAVALLAQASCVSLPGAGTSHVLRPGENLYRLSRYYRVPVRHIKRANRIRDVADIPAGSRLWIPGSRRAQPSYSLAPTSPDPTGIVPGADLRALAQRDGHLEFSWPLRGQVSSGFGRRNGRRHEGIDISARRGSRIVAAESGRVIHSGANLGAYGKVVILKHAGRYQTIYAHNRRNLVRKGQFVEKGQVVAEVGTSGNASGPHLHFEIRRDRRPLDPLRHLP